MTAKDTRLSFVEMVFEKFGGCGLSLNKSALLTSYLYSKENSLIVDIGANYTHVTPIFEGFVLPKSALKVDQGGQYITDKLREIVSENNPRTAKPPYIRHPGIMEKPALARYCQATFFDDVKKAVCKVHETSLKNFFFNKTVDNKNYELPDKQALVVSREYYDVPELLFSQEEPGEEGLASELVSLPRCITQAKEKIPLDKRKETLSNIILAGGTSNLPGLTERLQRTLQEAQEDSFYLGKIKVCGNRLERQHSSWLGGSVVASMSLFGDLLMTRQEFEEHGSLLIERKCN